MNGNTVPSGETGARTGSPARPGHPGTSEHLEIERKYDVGAGFVLPDLSGLTGVARITGPRAHRLTAVYFDTADRRLAASRITLRRRTGGEDAGWHLKLPAGEGARREVHAPLGDGCEPVPGQLSELVAGRAGGRALGPIARLETARTLLWLVGPGGGVLAEIADDRVSGSLPAAGAGAGGTDWREPVTWREIEVELKNGPAGLLDTVGERLREAGAAPSAAVSKLGRLLSGTGARERPLREG